MREELDELAARAYQEFVDVSDYIWKSPRLIEHETKLELDKLKKYFDYSPKLAELRWRLESHKLERVFPSLISVGNLFSVVSLFESYLLLLSSVLQKHTGRPVSTVRGQGVSRLINYLKLLGVDPTRLELWDQVQAALKIRNCLAHANGLLAWSRDEQELRRIQTSGTYLSKEHNEGRKAIHQTPDEVEIRTSALGDQLQIDNQYTYLASYYLREYFIALCRLSSSVDRTT